MSAAPPLAADLGEEDELKAPEASQLSTKQVLEELERRGLKGTGFPEDDIKLLQKVRREHDRAVGRGRGKAGWPRHGAISPPRRVPPHPLAFTSQEFDKEFEVERAQRQRERAEALARKRAEEEALKLQR